MGKLCGQRMSDFPKPMELTILMPCLKEALTVKKCVSDAINFLHKNGIHGEVLIADNGSTDESCQIARQAGARVVEIKERGYGAALLGGINAAHGRYIIMGDADDSYDFTDLQPFMNALRGGAQLVMGNRFRGGIADGAMPFLHRWLGNPVLSALGRLFFKIPVGDFHCGLRAFHTQSVRNIHLTASGMEFATEMVAKASFAGLRIVEVPTTLRPDGRDRAPHLRTWRDGWRHLRFMLLFSPLWLFLVPGFLLLALCTAGLLTLLQGPIQFGGIGLDVHTMLFCGMGVSLGFQALQWGALVQWLGVKAGMRRTTAYTSAKWINKLATVEAGLLLGIAFFIPGLWWAVELTSQWIQSDFGAVGNSAVLRSAIAASTLMIVGAQTVGGSLFAAALNAGIESGFIRLRG